MPWEVVGEVEGFTSGGIIGVKNAGVAINLNAQPYSNFCN